MLLCLLLTFFNMSFFKKIFQEHYQSVKLLHFFTVCVWFVSVARIYLWLEHSLMVLVNLEMPETRLKGYELFSCSSQISMYFVLVIILKCQQLLAYANNCWHLKLMIRTEQEALSAVLVKKIVSFFGNLKFIKIIIFLSMKNVL